MADSQTLHCSLLTPDREVLTCEATFVAIPGHDGEIGFLRNRSALVCKLGVGEVRIQNEMGTARFLVDGGFAQMLDNVLSILTSYAEPAQSIDPAFAAAALKAALEMPGLDASSHDLRESAVARARLRIASRG